MEVVCLLTMRCIQPCKYFERGFCRYGKKCRFIHRAKSKSYELKKLVSCLKIEIETKFKELNILISNQVSEILELKTYLNDRILQATIVSNSKSQPDACDSQQPSFIYKSCKDDINTQAPSDIKGSLPQNTSQMQIFISENSPKTKYCDHELHGEKAGLRWSKCKNIYCSTDQTLAKS